ncbi:MAG TPA: hypothetical protein VF235_08860, partial [Actinomycetota bacterium]
GMSDTGGMAPPPPPPPSGGGGFHERGLGDILSAAWNLYMKNAAQLIQIVAIVVVPLALLQAFLLQVVIKPCVVREVDSLGDLEDLVNRCSGGLGRTLLAGALTFFISVAVQQLLVGALIRGGAGSLLGRPVDVGASYKYAFSRLGGLIGLAFLIAIVVGIGFILLIIPGVIFAVFLSMAVPAFIVERKGVTDAMSRSWNLVSGSWWFVLGVIVVAGILASIVTGILNAIGGNNFFLYWIFSTIGLLITAPFTALVTIVLYVDLRIKREQLTPEVLAGELDVASA